MFGKLGRLIPGLDRSPEARFKAALARLEEGWSLEAFQQLRQCAQDGLTEARYELGRRYEQAIGVVQDFGDAVHWYTQAAEDGHREAQSRLGLIFLTGAPSTVAPDGNHEPAKGSLAELFQHRFDGTQDLAAAAHWNRVAAAAGDPEARLRLGHLYASGLGVVPDLQRADALFRGLAESGNLAGMTALGVLLAGGYGTPMQPEAAAALLRPPAASGDAHAQFWLGTVLEQLPQERHPDDTPAALRSAAECYRLASEQGHATAMYRLGLIYWSGRGVPRDHSLAETWLRRAATRDLVEAMRALAQLQLEQPGNDGVDAANLLWQASEQGDRRSAALLGELYLQGRGLPRDPVEAARWLRFAGEEARPEALMSLASLESSSARDADRGYANAAEWLRHAAEQGDLAAKFTMGSLYWRGKGVPAAPAEAAAWYREAAEAGSAPAAFYLGLILGDADTPLGDDAEALRWFNKAAQGGHAVAVCNVALMVMIGRGTERDPRAAVGMLESAAEQGNVSAAELLAEWYCSGTYLQVAPDRARGLLLRALDLGSVPAARLMVAARRQGQEWPVNWPRVRSVLEQAVLLAPDAGSEFDETAARAWAENHLALGFLLDQGYGGRPDSEAAQPHFTAAAQAGLSDAQAWMGDRLRTHDSQGADPTVAEEWYRRAAQQGHLGALIALAGLLQAKSKTDPRDEENLFGLWLTAAGQGHALAQREVAHAYLAGRGCRRYPQGAVRWLNAAASQGDAEAQYVLACCHRDGTGTRADWALARLWFERAAEQNHPAAQRCLNQRNARKTS